MRNEQLAALGETLAGEWDVTMSDAFFLEPPGTEVHGTVTIEWLGEAFLVHHLELEGESTSVIGRSDARNAFEVLYHDDRGVLRRFAMTWSGSTWTLLREDPDFHQRFVADVEPDVIRGRWEASEDEGATWRKDFDLIFDRASD